MTRGRPRRSNDHGQYGYARRNNCRCQPCLAVVRAARKRQDWERHNGISNVVDPARARAHVKALLANGLTYQQMHHASGRTVWSSQVRALIEGSAKTGRPLKFIESQTEARILAIPLHPERLSFTMIPAVGIHRRILALRWLGYTHADLARELGVTYYAVARYMLQQQVRSDSVEAFDKMYQRLCMTIGPNERERWIAYRNGFVPPMAWEDIDDVTCEPEWDAIACIVQDCNRSVKRMSLCATHYERAQNLGATQHASKFRYHVSRMHTRVCANDLAKRALELAELGLDEQHVAARLGITTRHVSRLLREAA